MRESSATSIPPRNRGGVYLLFGFRAGNRRWRAWRAALCLAAGCAGAVAQGPAPGEEVAILYNEAFGPDSRAVARHYAEARGVPAKQLIPFSLPKTEAISRKVFHDDLQRPLIKALESRGLARFPKGKDAPTTPVLPEAKVRYLVLAYGMPLKITADPGLKEEVPEALAGPLRRNEASVDTELACLPLLHRGAPLTGPIRNVLFGSTNVAAFHPTNGVFLVTRLDGPNRDVAMRLVDLSLAAETNGLWGRAWFDERGLPTNSPYAPGDQWIRNAYLNVRRAGFESSLDTDPATFPAAKPLPQIALYAGWYDGGVSGPFTRPPVEFMPGAVAYHLHSFSARQLRTATGNWAGPLLARGAAATLGCVEEPYLDLTPNVGVFFTWLVGMRHNLAQSAYASLPALSWQITIIGDPLYRPMARDPRTLHEELQRTGSELVAWSTLRIVNLNLASGTPPAPMIEYLRSLPLTATNAVLGEKLADLLRDERRVDAAAEAYQTALYSAPSPNQRLQIQFKLIELLSGAGREGPALDVCERFFEEQPDHPARLRFLRLALPLARKQSRADLVALCEREIARLTPPPPPAATNSPAGTTNAARP